MLYIRKEAEKWATPLVGIFDIKRREHEMVWSLGAEVLDGISGLLRSFQMEVLIGPRRDSCVFITDSCFYNGFVQ